MLCMPVITREMCEFSLSLNLSSLDNLPFKFLSHMIKRPYPSIVHCADSHRSLGLDFLPLQTEQTHKQKLQEMLSAVPLQQPFAASSCETPSPVLPICSTNGKVHLHQAGGGVTDRSDMLAGPMAIEHGRKQCTSSRGFISCSSGPQRSWFRITSLSQCMACQACFLAVQ